ncbi:MAG: DNA mismatch repair endonuclease MutL [Gemmatimonadetes bacterium]|nr:DNA mismatch repair endonuclease MutL [Gemmatimonadota bacterium]
MLKGDLASTPLPQVLRQLADGAATGCLNILDGAGESAKVYLRGGRVDAVEGCARRVGTTVTVRSLFFNVPARAKFLRSAASEARAVSEVATTLALAHPEVAFRLESNGRDLIDVAGAPEVRSRIGALWGEALAGELIPVTHTIGGASVSGWIERPHSATAAGRRTYLFVNGRAFSDRHLVRAADRGYQTTLPPGVRPSLFLFLDLAEGEVDVNVHPTKAEVRFRDGIGIERLVEEGVRLALAPLQSAATLGARSLPHLAADYPASAPERSVEVFPAVATETTDQMSLFVAGSRGEPRGPEEDSDGARVQPAMWQVHNTYIFAETRSGLIIVDQHSAHERVLYEDLMRSYDSAPPASQRLLFPITLRLSPAECSVIEQLAGLFARMGFEIEPFGGRSVIVQAVPVPHAYFDADRCLREMIAELTDGSPLVDSARNQHQRVALSFACKAAIKAGQRLSQQEMTELFDRLFATELPYHDIHGRPTIVDLSLAELHNRFRRGA